MLHLKIGMTAANKDKAVQAGQTVF